MTRFALAAPCLLLGGCVVAQQPVETPDGNEAAVIVASAALGEPVSGVARHPWIAFREDGRRSWQRYEVARASPVPPYGIIERNEMSPLTDYAAGGGDTRIHGTWRGREAEEAIECLHREVPRYPYRNYYRAWPGPNSNTFVDYMMRECDLHADLPSPSIGKDYRGLVVGVSPTSGGTGVQLETPVVGLKLGLTEGVEVHLFGMAWGVDVWPPALVVPIGPGRIGFDDR